MGGGGGDSAWDAWSRDFAAGREPAAFWPMLLDELRPLVAGRLPGRAHEWEDVLQETVVSLLEVRAAGGFEPARGTVAALAASIARRRCADRLRAVARRAATSLEASPGREPADPGAGPEAVVIEAEARRARRRALGRARGELRRKDARRGSRRAQAVLLRFRHAIASDDLRFVDGGRPTEALAPWEEVAERMDLTVEAARQNGSRGLRALRELWRAEIER